MKIAVVSLAAALCCGIGAAEVTLFDAATAEPSSVCARDGANVELKNGLLTVSTQPGGKSPGVAIRGDWDVSRYGEVEVEFGDNGFKGRYTLLMLNDNGKPFGKGSYVAMLASADVKQKVCRQFLPPYMPEWSANVAKLTRVRTWALPFMTWLDVPPGGLIAWDSTFGRILATRLDPAKVREIALCIDKPTLPHKWSIRRITAKGEQRPTDSLPAFTKMGAKEFFPFVDVYGQFKHREWPDKVHSDADLAAQRVKEEKDLAAHPGPQNWNKWGGWATGPKFEKTGGFSTRKWNGKWWIVDPDGCLWWSHGPVRVTPSCATTALDAHEYWFEKLPKKGHSDFEFYSTRDQLLLPYYAKWGKKKIYDFSARNIARKYGEGWYEKWSDLAHRRLRSWGCNTIANSSDKAICLMKRTPYTDRFEIHSRPIAGHKGGWWNFCDPFDPSFRAEIRQKTVDLKEQFEDPWCFGFFVDNEHHWGDSCTFAESTIKSPADQPCKRVFRERLRAKYGDVAKLNEQWKTDYADWEAFLASTTPPARAGARADLEAFTSEIAETYYRIIREEFKKAAPGKLYLGCRWSGAAPFTVHAAAKYCDVLSYNIYQHDLSKFKLPKGVDKPVMVGEFHFGALDRGPFCPGLILLRDQHERALAYKRYVRSALEHPNFVGVHWHQFSDQSTGGRFDGENMQVGWTDVCDTPYWETIAGIREIGCNLYQIRAGEHW